MTGRTAVVAMLWVLGASAWAAEPLPPDLEAAVTEAARGGAPAELLESKAREGLAKGVPAPRITAALQSWAADWLRAEALLGASAGGEAHPDVVAAAAAALREGADPGQVGGLAGSPLPSDALWTLVDLLNLGLSPPSAFQLVALAARSGDPTVALHSLPEATRVSLAQWGPTGAASHLEDALNNGQLTALSHGADAPGRSGDAPGHSDDKGDKAKNGKAGGKP